MVSAARCSLILALAPSIACAHVVGPLRAPVVAARAPGALLREGGPAPVGKRRRILAAGGTCAAAVAGVQGVHTGAALALFHRYEALALASPVATKSVTSGVAYLLGDVLAQVATQQRRGNARSKSQRRERAAAAAAADHLPQSAEESGGHSRIDWKRVARSCVAGLVSHGPQLHLWCLFLDRFINLGPGVWAARGALLFKILLDQTVFSLYMNAAYCAIVETLSGRSLRAVAARVRASAWPSLRSSWRFWPGVHLLKGSEVTSHLRVLGVDAVVVVRVAILATCVSTAQVDDEGHAPVEAAAQPGIPAAEARLAAEEELDESNTRTAERGRRAVLDEQQQGVGQETSLAYGDELVTS